MKHRSPFIFRLSVCSFELVLWCSFGFGVGSIIGPSLFSCFVICFIVCFFFSRNKTDWSETTNEGKGSKKRNNNPTENTE
ncbi:hypothetical protein BKA57DRAFT_461507 [Linnemannia elongata]|nr:hypothetical protein BKA57DRAFT_461507 [Linnemannia elongata]